MANCGLIWRQSGQTQTEYSLILTRVAVGVVIPAVNIMRTALAGAFGDTVSCILRVTC